MSRLRDSLPRSHITVSTAAPDTGTKSVRAGHVLTVFRKSAAGKWLLARDANFVGAAGGEG